MQLLQEQEPPLVQALVRRRVQERGLLLELELELEQEPVRVQLEQLRRRNLLLR